MEKESNDISKCPFHNGDLKHNVGGGGTGIREWWPNKLKIISCVSIRHCQIHWVKILTTQKLLKVLTWMQ